MGSLDNLQHFISHAYQKQNPPPKHHDLQFVLDFNSQLHKLTDFVGLFQNRSFKVSILI
jgi:hypothetical protein